MKPDARLPSRIPFALLLASIAILTAASAARSDTAWPHAMKTSKGSMLSIYEPSLETLEGDRLSGHAACSVRPAGESDPIFGVFWFTASVTTDKASREVKLVSIDVTQVKFPDRASELEKSFATIMERDLPASGLSWSMDWMNEALQATKAERAASTKINNNPPAIVVSTDPAVLIQFDGEPLRRPIEGSDLSRIVNTPYFVVYDPARKRYYLGSDQYWYESKEPLGPWTVIKKPPSNVLALKPEETSASAPAKSAGTGAPPKIIVATQPTELIVFQGEPQFRPIAQTDLLYVTNSDKDVFKDVASQDYYVLLSGRWFASAKASGPWSYVPSDKLPASFAAIPSGSEFARVLASVPGTPQADEAVLAAQVPQVTAVPRGSSDFEVWYDEDPQFRKIKGTDIEYAVNTSTSVFRIDGKYYACDKAVWYVSDGPDGPWDVCDKRPEGLEAIPPDNRNYNTKYVYVYDSTPTSVYVGYTPGYLGCYPYGGSVYYGTGYSYDPWYGAEYYAYPWTWGLGAMYTPYAGWGFGFGFGTGFVNCGMTWGGGYYGWPYYGGGYYGYYGGYYGGYGNCGGWYGPGGYYSIPRYTPHNTNPYSAGYGSTRTRTTAQRPTSIYDRDVTRYRKGTQYSGASGKQAAAPSRSRSVAPNGSRYAVPHGSRYGVPNGNRYNRPYQQGNSRYRDRSISPRSTGNPGSRTYDRSWTGYRGGQSRGYPSQVRGNVTQYRGMQGGQSYGRSLGGGRGGYGGGGGRHR